MLLFSMQSEDYYQILGIEHTATTGEIKKAFRNLAKRYHPDRNSSSMSAKQFGLILKAYRILIDETSRMVFDTQRGYGFEEIIREPKVANKSTASSRNRQPIGKVQQNHGLAGLILIIAIYAILLILSAIAI